MRRMETAWAALAAAVLAVGCGSTQTGESMATENGGAGQPASRTSPSETSATPEAEARPEAGRAWVIFGADTVTAEVARTADERAEGLMYREDLPDGTGMLFVFPDSGIRSFWMSNTYVPLDIAYLDAAMTVVDIQQMEPQTTDPHESAVPAMFALEVPQGWFAAHGVTVGSQARIEFGLTLGGG